MWWGRFGRGGAGEWQGGKGPKRVGVPHAQQNLQWIAYSGVATRRNGTLLSQGARGGTQERGGLRGSAGGKPQKDYTRRSREMGRPTRGVGRLQGHLARPPWDQVWMVPCQRRRRGGRHGRREKTAGGVAQEEVKYCRGASEAD